MRSCVGRGFLVGGGRAGRSIPLGCRRLVSSMPPALRSCRSVRSSTWIGGTCGRYCPRPGSSCGRQAGSQVGVLGGFVGEAEDGLGNRPGIEVWSGQWRHGDTTTLPIGLADKVVFLAAHVGGEDRFVTVGDAHGFEVDPFRLGDWQCGSLVSSPAEIRGTEAPAARTFAGPVRPLSANKTPRSTPRSCSLPANSSTAPMPSGLA